MLQRWRIPPGTPGSRETEARVDMTKPSGIHWCLAPDAEWEHQEAPGSHPAWECGFTIPAGIETMLGKVGSVGPSLEHGSSL